MRLNPKERKWLIELFFGIPSLSIPETGRRWRRETGQKPGFPSPHCHGALPFQKGALDVISS
jgi:hypothetical protein